MRILMFGWEFPPHISGGLGVACFGLTRALADRGHKITFVVPVVKEGNPNLHLTLVGCNQIVAGTSQKLQEEWSKNVHFKYVKSLLHAYINDKEYLKMLERIEKHAGKKTPFGKDFAFSGEYGPNLMGEVVRYSLIARELAQIPHDVVHAHDWLTVLAGIEAKKTGGKPLVFHVHALEFDRSGMNVNQDVYNIERHGMEEADKIVAVSHYTKDLIMKHYGIRSEKIEVVHNAVRRDTDARSVVGEKQIRDKIVLFVGRITFQKGPDYFVEAAAKVLKKIDNVRFVMVGSGDMFYRMVERVAELNIGKYFHFTGFLKKAEVEKLYAQSDVYVMPSVSEPFGLSPLEAMQYNVPVIVSKQSGVAELLKNALKIDFWDVDDMANKIIALLEHDSLRQEIVKQSAEELKHIQWEKAAERVTSVYHQVTSR